MSKTDMEHDDRAFRKWLEESMPRRKPCKVKLKINDVEYDAKLIRLGPRDDDELELELGEIAIQLNGGQVHILKVKSDD